VAAVGEFLDDFGVGRAVTEHEIDEVAVLTRESRDFTSSPPSVGAGLRTASISLRGIFG
jgi:hypothetical protein